MTSALSLARGSVAPRPPGSTLAIARLATPLVAFFLIPSGVELIVLTFLGRVGTAALAGVGAAGALYGILLALLFGLDTAVQASVARTVGAGRNDAIAEIYADAVVLGAPLGAGLAIALWVGAPVVLPALIGEGPAAQIGVAWARAAAPSLVFFALTIPANAVWIGWGRPARSLIVTAAMAPIQIAASYVFMLDGSRRLGAAGAGAAMSVAGCIATAVQLWLLTRRDGPPGFARRAPSAGGAARLARLGWPISLQQALNQVALMIVYPLVAGLGTPSLAIVNVIISLETLAVQLACAVGAAGGTLAGQALGAGAARRAGLVGWRAVGLGVLIVAPFGLVALMAPDRLLRLFLHEASTVNLGAGPMRLLGALTFAMAVSRTLDFALRGVGATRLGAAIPFAAQWLVRLPTSFGVVFLLGWGLVGLVSVQAGVAVAEAAAAAVIWASGVWGRSALARGGDTH